MNYRVALTWRVTASSHPKGEIIVADLPAVGKAIGEDAPDFWDVCYVIVTPTTAAATSDSKPAQPDEVKAA